jgi:RimJ/RimL family protein N-acetyltransferase
MPASQPKQINGKKVDMKADTDLPPKITLINIYDEHQRDTHGAQMDHFLYKLLEERDPVINISHRKMPRYRDHVAFIKSQPYREWFVIWSNEFNKLVGSLYITVNNEIGIFISKEFQDHGFGSEALKQIIERHKFENLYANINPKNYKSKEFFKKHGFKPFTSGIVQDVYIRERDLAS